MKPNFNRSLLALSLGALMLSSTTHAQSDLRAQTQTRVSSLFSFADSRLRDLNLSTKQKSQLAQIARQNASSTKRIWNDSTLTPTQRTQALRKIRAQSLATLTPAQRVQVDQAKQQATSRLLETALWVSGELELSGDQQKRVMKIVQTQMRGAKGFGAIRSSIVQTNSQIGAILTPKQRAKWTTIQSAARSEFVKRGKQWRANERELGLIG